MKAMFRPVVHVDPRPGRTDTVALLYVRSYLFVRAAAGVVGVVVPFALIFGDGLLFDGDPYPRDSLSAYYYSGARELFVGGLCITAVFLMSYKPFEKNLDNTLSFIAGFAAVTVAFFPKRNPGPVGTTPLQDTLGEGFVEVVHFTAANIFIAALGVLCYFFGRREGTRPRRPDHRSPRFWQTFHFVCAGLIAAAMLFIVVGVLVDLDRSLLVGETVAVLAFGASWLAKGLELDVLRRTPLGGEPESAWTG